MNLYLDIETLPAQNPEVLADIRAAEQSNLDAALAAIRVPGNYKKQETIDEWMNTEAPKQAQALRDAFEATVDATYRKTSFDGAYGNVCVIGWALDDQEPQYIADAENEAVVLSEFAAALKQQIKPNMELAIAIVGHNVSAFDLRFLVQRSIVRGIRPHPIIARAAQAKPWEADKVWDSMTQWAGAGKTVKLDKLCKALGIKSPKGELDGSKVWDFVKSGRIAEVADYCAADVTATRAVYKRMTFSAVPIIPPVPLAPSEPEVWSRVRVSIGLSLDKMHLVELVEVRDFVERLNKSRTA